MNEDIKETGYYYNSLLIRWEFWVVEGVNKTLRCYFLEKPTIALRGWEQI
jgi:hypothetical protein